MFNLPSFSLLMQGALETIFIALYAVIIGSLGGLALGILNSQKWGKKYWSKPIHVYVSLIRGIPLFVQVLIMYFAIPQLLGINLSAFVAGVLALGLNSSAYVAEIVRCGIDSIPKGQWEAAFVLGYNRWNATWYVILPQMLRNVLPALTNEMTALLKETSILMVIGVSELTKTGRDIVARNLDPLGTYLLVAAIYYLMTTSISLCASHLERRLKK